MIIVEDIVYESEAPIKGVGKIGLKPVFLFPIFLVDGSRSARGCFTDFRIGVDITTLVVTIITLICLSEKNVIF